MINVNLNNDNKLIPCILLAIFEIEAPRRNSPTFQEKKVLCFKRTKVIKKFKKRALVFIPWQHKQKELRIVDIEEITPQGNLNTEDFIKVSDFISPYSEELPVYYCEYKIKDYVGYDFVYSYPNFIANVVQCDDSKCYELLYKKQPDLLLLKNNL